MACHFIKPLGQGLNLMGLSEIVTLHLANLKEECDTKNKEDIRSAQLYVFPKKHEINCMHLYIVFPKM